MADANVLQEFLVSLGYKVDGNSQERFLTGLRNTALAVSGIAAGMVASLAKVAEQMEATFFVSQRTGAAVENIKALGFAFGQMGGTAGQARGALESLASFMRSSPGAGGWLQSLGVATKDAHGNARDTADVLGSLGQRLSSMPFYQAKAYASVAGIDEQTLLTLTRGMGQFSAQYHQMYQAAGIDAQRAAGDAHDYMNSLRGVGAAVGILGEKIASQLTKGAGEDLNRFREGLVANFGRISNAVTTAAKVVLQIADGLAHLAVRAMQALGDISDWFGHLDAGTRKVIEGFGLLLLAWRVLNAGFLTSPIGIIASLGAAILLLYDDYKTWKEGGKSLIDWAAWEPSIKQAKEAITWFITKLDEGVKAVGGWQQAFELFAVFLARKWLNGVLATIGQATAAMLGFGTATTAATEASALVAEGQVGRLAVLASRLAGLTAVGAGLTIALTPSSTQSQDSENAQLGRAPGTGAFGVPGKADQERGADVAMRYLTGRGMSAEEAAGYVGNAGRESGMDPGAHNKSGHWGLFQWDQTRQDAIFAHFHKRVQDMSMFEQLDAMMWERSQEGPEAAAGAAVSAHSGLASDASDAVGMQFERFKSKDMTPEQVADDLRKRRERANNAYLRFKGTTGVAPAGVPTPAQAAAPLAGQMLRTANQPSIAQTTNITVNGVSDPKKAADHVQSAQTRVNGDMIRNMMPAAY